MNLIASKSVRLLLLVGIWVSTPHLSLCQTDTVRQQIQHVLQKADTSFQHKDVSGCLAMLTDDFQGTDIRGTRFNKGQTRQSLIKEFSRHSLIKRSAEIKSQVLDVAHSGQQASVVYHEHLVITIEGHVTHQKHLLTFDANRRSTWIKEKDGWREQKETQLTSRIMQDGVLKSAENTQ